MNNLRLLAGLFLTALLSDGVCIYGQSATTLEQIFEAAEANSKQLRPYFTAAHEAEKEIAIARSGRLPDISADISLSYMGDGFTTKRTFADYQKAPIPHFGNTAHIAVNQPLYTGGALTAGIEIAELKSTAARFAADMQRDNIRFQLTGFYLDIYKYFNLRSVVESNIAAAEKVLEEMRARYEQGLALQNDIIRYELLLSNLQLELTRIDNTLKILNTNLIIIAGLPDGTKIVPDTTILARSLPATSESYWLAEAEANSPAIKLAGTGVQLSRRAVDMAKSERRPKIGLQVGWTLEGPILVEVPPINRNLSYWYVGMGVKYNISSLYKGNKSLAKSKLSAAKAADDLAATRENVSLGVRAEYVRYLEACEELRTREKGVELAQTNYCTTSTRYSADMALITDMLDAANSLLDAQQQLVNARINIIYYYYKLSFITGKI